MILEPLGYGCYCHTYIKYLLINQFQLKFKIFFQSLCQLQIATHRASRFVNYS